MLKERFVILSDEEVGGLDMMITDEDLHCVPKKTTITLLFFNNPVKC